MNTIEAQSLSPRSLKRDHDEYESYGKEDCQHDTQFGAKATTKLRQHDHVTPLKFNHAIESIHDPQPHTQFTREPSPAQSSTSSLTDAGTLTPGAIPSPSAFAKLNGQGPPVKKQKMTFQEKQIQEAIREVRRKEIADEKARKEAERAQKDVEKARREAEKEVERLKREAEREQKRLLKEVENAKKEEAKKLKEEERQKKEAEKQKKEEEKQKIEEEKQKKARNQPKIASFFGTPKVVSKEASPAPSTSTDILDSPSKPEKTTIEHSDYEKLFPTFYVKEHVRLAALNQFSGERWGSDNAEEEIDAFITGGKLLETKRTFSADLLFNCPDIHTTPRGRQIPSIRGIMEEASGLKDRPIDLTTDSQNSQIKHRRRLLSAVPFKSIKFSTDVRPPYSGTHTKYRLAELQKLAKQPFKPRLPDLQYDYDSEAEWVEDGDEDDAEDLTSEMGDEEDAEDADQDVDDFLDDADDVLANRVKELPADQQPKCSGLCFENHRRKGPSIKMYGFHMEIMHENVNVKAPIDPWSTVYWDTPPAASGIMDPPRIPLSTIKSISSNINVSKQAFFGPPGAVKSTSASSLVGSKGFIANVEDVKMFRQEVEGSNLSKIGLIDVVHKKMIKSTKAQVKASIESWAQHVGSKRADKVWTLTEACPP